MSDRRHLTIVPGILTRGDCQDGPRPCPMASCRYHVVPDLVAPHASRRIPEGWAEAIEEGNFGVLPATCTLDMADAGGGTLEDVAEVFGVSRERVRQVERDALDRVARSAGGIGANATAARQLADYDRDGRQETPWAAVMSETGGEGLEDDEPTAEWATGSHNRARDLDKHARYVEALYDAYLKASNGPWTPPPPFDGPTPESIRLEGSWALPVATVGPPEGEAAPTGESASEDEAPAWLTHVERAAWDALVAAGGQLPTLAHVALAAPPLAVGSQSRIALQHRARKALTRLRRAGLVVWGLGTCVYIRGVGDPRRRAAGEAAAARRGGGI